MNNRERVTNKIWLIALLKAARLNFQVNYFIWLYISTSAPYKFVILVNPLETFLQRNE